MVNPYPPKPIPAVVIKSIAGGLFLMSFFTLMWSGIAYGNLHFLPLLLFAGLICLVFAWTGFRFFTFSKKLPVLTTEEDKAKGKKMGVQFGIIFGIEGTAIPVVCGVLAALGKTDYILPAIALIVGLHFYPMARIFERSLDYYLATWTTLAAIGAILWMTLYDTQQEEAIGLMALAVSLATITYGIYMIREGRLLISKSGLNS